MKTSSAKKISTKLSVLGNRPEEVSLRLANLIFFVLTIFFGIVYFIVASTQEISSSPGYLEDDISKYLIAIISVSIVLLIMEFYSSLHGNLRTIRLFCVLALGVLVGLSIHPVIESAENANDDPGETLVYTFSALTLGFGGAAAILNILEVFKNY